MWCVRKRSWRKWRRRQPYTFPAVILLTVLLAAVGVGGALGWQQVAQRRHLAEEALFDGQALLRQRHPGADAISAGMSHDLEAAVKHGSTHVRVGTALLGRREPVFG